MFRVLDLHPSLTNGALIEMGGRVLSAGRCLLDAVCWMLLLLLLAEQAGEQLLTSGSENRRQRGMLNT